MYDDPELKIQKLQETDAFLEADAIQMAEDMTGEKVGDGLAMLLHMTHSHSKNAFLASNKDSHMGMSFDDFVALALSLGFVEIYSEIFNPAPKWEPASEEFKVFWRNGILLTCESYGRKREGKKDAKGSINSAKTYFQYTHKFPDDYKRQIHCSGGWTNKSRKDFHEQCTVPFVDPIREKFKAEGKAYSKECFEAVNQAENEWWEKNKETFIPILEGSDDIRDGLKHELSKLEMYENILPQWVEAPFLWLLNYMDTESEEYKNDSEFGHFHISLRKMEKFPQEVQQAICMTHFMQELDRRKADSLARKKNRG